MSISLNNHESRITALESIGSESKHGVNWSNAIGIRITTSGYTSTNSGWVIVYNPKDAASYTLTVNGKVVATSNGQQQICFGDSSCTIPVNKNDIVKTSGSSWSGYFLPFTLYYKVKVLLKEVLGL